jgi:hypothetical protein
MSELLAGTGHRHRRRIGGHGGGMTIRANSSTPYRRHTGAQDFNHPKLAITYRLATSRRKIDVCGSVVNGLL